MRIYLPHAHTMLTGLDHPPPSPDAKTAKPTKRATNLTLSVDVLDAAKRLDINISQACDAHLRALVRDTQARRWREEHADFIAAYNATVESEGLPLDEWRGF
jgi:antitoxin CcdA